MVTLPKMEDAKKLSAIKDFIGLIIDNNVRNALSFQILQFATMLAPKGLILGVRSASVTAEKIKHISQENAYALKELIESTGDAMFAKKEKCIIHLRKLAKTDVQKENSTANNGRNVYKFVEEIRNIME